MANGVITQLYSGSTTPTASVPGRAGAGPVTGSPINSPPDRSVQQPNSVSRGIEQSPSAPVIVPTAPLSVPIANKPSVTYTASLPQQPQPPSLQQAEQLLKWNQTDAALTELNAYIRVQPKDPNAYALRGDIYAAKRLWDKAETDFQTTRLLDGGAFRSEFNLAEIDFVRKNYAAARAGYVGLQKYPVCSDIAAFKIFLCDLYGGHEDAAAKELEAFNKIGTNASYYFANAASSLHYQKRQDARGWFISAEQIYPPAKFKLYSNSLDGRSISGWSSDETSPSPSSVIMGEGPAILPKGP